MAPRLVLATLGVLALSLIVRSQDAPALRLSEVTDPMGQGFPIPADIRGTMPGVNSFGSPYLLLNKTDGLALWYVQGGHVYPVAFEGGQVPKGKAAPQVVNSGGNWFLMYVVDGGNEFWRLDAEQAKPVTLPDGKLFSQRSHITRGGDKAVLYQGDYTGKTDLYEIDGETARAIRVTDKTDHGTAQYAWHVGGKLLVAFYINGTHDFYWLADGAFKACWERNGTQDDELQIDSIHAAWWNGQLFLNLVRRDASAEVWTVRDGKLASVSDKAASWYKEGLVAAGRDGLYFIGNGALEVSDGKTTRTIRHGDDPLTLDTKAALTSQGGGVLVNVRNFDEFTCWLVGDSAHKLGTHKIGSVARYVLAASTGATDIVQFSDEQGVPHWKVFKAGKESETGVEGAPEDFGAIESAWSVAESGKQVSYTVERKAGTKASFRLWRLQ
ncbi:MAG: hypothetical protein KDB82_08225 [Planctomycetes bacterium]|nr:hypothetical protein [Planctomycetota bacterium]